MDYQSAFAISAAGMKVEEARFNISSLNLANANTTPGTEGVTYRPLRVISSSAAPGIFENAFTSALAIRGQALAMAPQVEAIVEQNVTPRRVLDPGHPAADEKGFVEYPGINPANEMINLMTALRAYEANVVAINAAKSMALKALDIGSGS